MLFDKDVVYLGYREMTMKDGTVLYAVSMYADGQALEVSVLATNAAVMSAVKSLKFGDSAVATFALRKADKLYRLSLTGLA